MINVEVFSNQACLPLRNAVGDFPIESNFHRAIAQAERYAGNEATFVSGNIAIVPLVGDERLVITSGNAA
ncbi:hypothetical protein [Thaumasiovibrio sp. DFM-14]|uniref:hypothetical protein n=1 Tax=Thaumasiovibrio sp. DFM-14 TaxID=3384792 RepID=UPI0039A0F7EA